MPKFLVADDHPLFREALCAALPAHFPQIELVESEDLASTLNALEVHSDIDMVLLDLNMPGCDDFFGLLKVRQTYPELPVAVVSASESLKVVAHVMGFGAKGYLPKTLPTKEIASAIDRMLGGEVWMPENMQQAIAQAEQDELALAHRMSTLTSKQFQVLKLLQDGMLNKQIAHTLNITEATVKSHISAIFRKLDVNTRTQAVLLAEQMILD